LSLAGQLTAFTFAGTSATQAAGSGSRPSIAGTECEGAPKITAVIASCAGGGECSESGGPVATDLVADLNTENAPVDANGCYEGSRYFNYNTWACATTRTWVRIGASCP
jgi:hypothetical protein